MANPRERSKAICASISIAGFMNSLGGYEHKKTRRASLESEAWRVLLKKVYAAFKAAAKQNYPRGILLGYLQSEVGNPVFNAVWNRAVLCKTWLPGTENQRSVLQRLLSLPGLNSPILKGDLLSRAVVQRDHPPTILNQSRRFWLKK